MADDLDEGRRMKQVDAKTHRTAFKHVAPTRPRPRAGPPPHRDPCADSGPELPRSVPRGGRGWAVPGRGSGWAGEAAPGRGREGRAKTRVGGAGPRRGRAGRGGAKAGTGGAAPGRGGRRPEHRGEQERGRRERVLWSKLGERQER
jgi:hypothetical protein